MLRVVLDIELAVSSQFARARALKLWILKVTDGCFPSQFARTRALKQGNELKVAGIGLVAVRPYEGIETIRHTPAQIVPWSQFARTRALKLAITHFPDIMSASQFAVQNH